MKFAPIALFVYNRLEHTRRTVESVLRNSISSETDVYIFADGPKSPNATGVSETREYVRSINGFKSVKVFEQEKNLGLVQSTFYGMDMVCRERGKVIMLEDDLVVSPYFLDFMNKGLDLYENESEVISINGYTYPIEVGPEENFPETFFVKGADCWGFATWKRGWDLLEKDGHRLLREIKDRGLEREFDREGSFPYTNMLREHNDGVINSWSIRWYASALLKNKLTLYPCQSLVHNIGHDGTGTNCPPSHDHDSIIYDKPVSIGGIPIEENSTFVRKFADFFRKTYAPRTVTVADALALADQKFRSGSFTEAKEICRLVLQAQPNNAEAQLLSKRISDVETASVPAGDKIQGAYDKASYARQSVISSRSAQRIVPSVLAKLSVASVLDVGCGVGTFLREFSNNGVRDFLGIDGADVDADQLFIEPSSYQRMDLSRSINLGRTYDLVVSLEVAEHLPAESADQFVENLCRHGAQVLFSAAVPFQGGEGHLNEQWPSYWAEKFAKHGFQPFDILRDDLWGDPEVAFWYRQNCIVFANPRGVSQSPVLQATKPTQSPNALNRVHPDLFLERARSAETAITERLCSLGGAFEFRKDPEGKVHIKQVRL